MKKTQFHSKRSEQSVVFDSPLSIMPSVYRVEKIQHVCC